MSNTRRMKLECIIFKPKKKFNLSSESYGRRKKETFNMVNRKYEIR